MHPDAQYKVDLLARTMADNGLRVLVETGLYMGGGSGMKVPADLVDHYVIFDWQQQNCEWATDWARTGTGRMVQVIQGDSAVTLPAWLPTLQQPALFWLDAHGIDDDFPGFPPFPLWHELEAIARHHLAGQHHVLIDDLAMMGGAWQPLVGAPELRELRYGISERYATLWDAVELDEIMRLTPRPPAPTSL